MKKLVIFLLCMSLAFSTLPMNAMAAGNDKTNAMAAGSGNASDENETEEVERVIETIDSGRDVRYAVRGSDDRNTGKGP